MQCRFNLPSEHTGVNSCQPSLHPCEMSNGRHYPSVCPSTPSVCILKSQISVQQRHHADVCSLPLQRLPVVVPTSRHRWAGRRYPETDVGASLRGVGWGQPADLGSEGKRHLHWKGASTATQEALCWTRYWVYAMFACVFLQRRSQ